MLVTQYLQQFSLLSLLLALSSWHPVSLLAAPLEWQLGEVEANQLYRTDFEVPNHSDRTLVIRQVHSSCGCLDAKLVRPEAAPGTSATVALTLDTTDMESSFRGIVYLQTTWPDEPLMSVIVSSQLAQDFLRHPLVVQLYYDPEAPNWKQAQSLAEQLRRQHAGQVEVRLYDMTEPDSYRQLYQLEERLGVKQVAPVEAFVGELYIAGVEQILVRLPVLVDNILKGEITNKLEAHQDAPEVHLYYTPGCRECRQVKAFLAEAQQRLRNDEFPVSFSLQLHDITSPEEYAQLVALEETQSAASHEAVSIWIGNTRLAGIQQIQNRFEDAIRGTSPTSSSALHSFPEGMDAVKRRFQSFSAIAVLGAGLLDGVNPCAFTTLVFFLSMLSYTGRRRHELLVVGGCFAMAVFATYLFLGMGLFRTLQALEGYAALASILYYGAAALALILAAFSLYDALAYARSKRNQAIKLQLPARIKQLIHRVIRQNLKARHLALGALTIGVLVSALESVCTGQIYLPTIALVARDPTLRTHAYGYLLLYNLMFIIPLLTVFGIAFVGIRSEAIGRFAQRHVVTTKLLTASLFVMLAVLVLVSG